MAAKENNQETQLAVRLPYSDTIQVQFNVDASTWKVLTEAVWPEAQSVDSVILALAYCKSRNLDPLKRVVHIVPVWNTSKGRMVDTIWPSIAEARTTATRTGNYAGRDITVFGPERTEQWTPEKGQRVEITFPEWAQVTVYRVVKGVRVAFAGPQVFWLETFAKTKGGCPNAMWTKRPHGQLDKCAEMAALRAAFPEELGDEWTEADGPGMYQHTDANTTPLPAPIQPPRRLAEPPKEPSADPTKPVPSSTQGTGTNGTSGSTQTEPNKNDGQSEAEQQMELVNLCTAIAQRGKAIVTHDDYKTLSIGDAPEEIAADDLPFHIVKELSTWPDGKKIHQGNSNPCELTGVPLKLALEKARKAWAVLEKTA